MQEPWTWRSRDDVRAVELTASMSCVVLFVDHHVEAQKGTLSMYVEL